jgi:hypothetical protein
MAETTKTPRTRDTWRPVSFLPRLSVGPRLVRADAMSAPFDQQHDVPLLAPSKGPLRMRFLPPTWAGAKHFCFEVKVRAQGWWDQRWVAYVVDRGREDMGVQALVLVRSLDRQIAKLCIDRRGGVIRLDHPERGHDVLMDCEASGKVTSLSLDPQDSPLGSPAYMEFAIDNPLPDVLARTPRDLELG